MIYCIQCGKSGPIKIGYSSFDDPTMRLRDLQYANPEELFLLGCDHYGTKEEEKHFHQKCAKDKVRGEWFYPTYDVMFQVRCITQYIRPDQLHPLSPKELRDING